ncbi:hypothetical protein acsn021_33130 [Anaerocolumna cellulosilytica]|uniref:ABC-2 type transporter transmembrane domain-containing protein n=1 Tax=Anaerocolumna cellulosilytica TaxID=433286 RepID=A0A6S6QYN5_9FIRM|nr:ABC transporter permease [Anaerocolumna cellulosilytica]MBB5196863.1 ABC-2 type transport system permease protein [Anaerocolumna cellulosilytica]BCJ95744.1 hypothetical protein acsn021_33130 [Anaerocolumna cellulosilytica]
MQVFKIYFKILKNSSLSLALYAIVFVILITVISLGQAKDPLNFEETKVNTALVNYDSDSVFVQNFLAYLSNYCNFIELEGEENELIDVLIFRKAEYMLTIPYGFGEDIMKGKDVNVEKKTISGGLYETAIDQAINRYITTAKVYLYANPILSEQNVVNYVNQDMNTEATVSINYNHIGRNYSFHNKYFNFASYILLASSFLGVGMVMLTFYNVHIRRRNLVTPMNFKSMDLQLIAGNIIFVIAWDIFIILLGILLAPDKYIDLSVLMFWFNFFIFSLGALSIGFLSAILVKRKEVNNMLSFILPLGLSFISGAFIPQTMLDKGVLKLAQFSPLYWFVRANDSIAVLQSYAFMDMIDIFKFIGIQFGFAVAVFSVALVAGKQWRQSN